MKFGSAVILAGGESSRMGFDKQLIAIDNTSLVEKIINKLKQSFLEIIVVTNTPIIYKDFDVILVQDAVLHKGPLAGIHIGLQSACSDFVYFIGCDMPFFDHKYIDFMKSILSKNEYDGCVMKNKDFIEPLNAFYKKDLCEEAWKYIGNNQLSLNNFIQKHNFYQINNGQEYIFSESQNIFESINTPLELETLNAQPYRKKNSGDFDD